MIALLASHDKPLYRYKYSLISSAQVIILGVFEKSNHFRGLILSIHKHFGRYYVYIVDMKWTRTQTVNQAVKQQKREVWPTNSPLSSIASPQSGRQRCYTATKALELLQNIAETDSSSESSYEDLSSNSPNSSDDSDSGSTDVDIHWCQWQRLLCQCYLSCCYCWGNWI